MSARGRLARVDGAWHQCPVAGCDARIKRRLLMCFSHWLQVPRSLQREVTEAFLAWRREPRDIGRMAALRLAQAAAIDSVKGHPEPTEQETAS